MSLVPFFFRVCCGLAMETERKVYGLYTEEESCMCGV